MRQFPAKFIARIETLVDYCQDEWHLFRDLLTELRIL